MKRKIGAGTSALAGLRPEPGLRQGKRLLPRKRPWLIAAAFILALCGVVFANYFQSFETDTFDWTGATRVPTTTHGVLSKTGAFHAEDQNLNGLTFTRWGGYSDTF